jgi:hypothetical protein
MPPDLTGLSDEELVDRLVNCDCRIRALPYSPLQEQLEALAWELRAEMERRRSEGNGQ